MMMDWIVLLYRFTDTYEGMTVIAIGLSITGIAIFLIFRNYPME